jgi:hypothetical protein
VLRTGLPYVVTGGEDTCENGCGFAAHLVVRDTYGAPAMRLQNRVALRVVLDLLLVDAAVYLDDEAHPRTAQVHDEAGKHLLAIEMKTAEPIGA